MKRAFVYTGTESCDNGDVEILNVINLVSIKFTTLLASFVRLWYPKHSLLARSPAIAVSYLGTHHVMSYVIGNSSLIASILTI